MTRPPTTPTTHTAQQTGARSEPRLEVTAWICPMCDGRGRWAPGERCMECVGFGLVARRPDPAAWGRGKTRRARRPPAVARKMCGDCAYRRGSPERDDGGDGPPLDRPFFCHRGLHVTDGGYTPPLMFGGLAIGGRLCAGQWFRLTGDGEDPDQAEPFTDTHPSGRTRP